MQRGKDLFKLQTIQNKNGFDCKNNASLLQNTSVIDSL